MAQDDTRDTLLLATPLANGGVEAIRVRVPEGLTRLDVYLQVIAEIPADEPQPLALNCDVAELTA